MIFSGSENLDLILEYAEWVIRVNHEDGLMVLFAAMLSSLVLLLFLCLLPCPARMPGRGPVPSSSIFSCLRRLARPNCNCSYCDLHFARVRPTSIFIVCFTLFSSSNRRMCSYRHNLACFTFDVMYSTHKSLIVSLQGEIWECLVLVLLIRLVWITFITIIRGVKYYRLHMTMYFCDDIQ